MNENISNKDKETEIPIINNEGAILDDVAAQSSVNNKVEETPPVENNPEPSQGIPKQETPPHTSKQYLDFASMAHGGVDKLYEMINEIVVPVNCPINKAGLRKRMPEDYEDMVKGLAQSLEISGVKIPANINWILYANLVVTSYGALITENIKAVREWKDHKKEKREPDNTRSQTEPEKHHEATIMLNPTYKGMKRRGDPRRHPKDCECMGCERIKERGEK